jgi:hypothetical protein
VITPQIIALKPNTQHDYLKKTYKAKL